MTTFLAWFQRIAQGDCVYGKLRYLDVDTVNVYMELLMRLSDAQRHRCAGLISKYY